MQVAAVFALSHLPFQNLQQFVRYAPQSKTGAAIPLLPEKKRHQSSLGMFSIHFSNYIIVVLWKKFSTGNLLDSIEKGLQRSYVLLRLKLRQ